MTRLLELEPIEPGDSGRVARVAREAGVRFSSVAGWFAGRWQGGWAEQRIRRALERLGWGGLPK